ncbi:transaldolase [Leucobacter chromiireducens]|uniref:Transaldolase n=1 Tax=Leucobacter chromiireducens subsp. chromiireducens TaxID=660067 RepID=A0ABS1SRE4_9MICO|nr:transaldolase [Leucobacter chromiireducens]MBL3690579.1 transaldolase [Leucobacter chromiireducens subsp. chromiireducens]
MTNSPTADLSEAGVSIWLDDLSRSRIESGELSALRASHNVVGVTTNPTIFASALAGGVGYGERIASCAARGLGVAETIIELTTSDVADACDLFAETYTGSGGADGRVSIEVEPRLARDTEGTIQQGRELWARVNRPNAMIKVPATTEGLPAITALIAEGISVNVTLIFSIQRYRQVINAYLTGLELARAAGKNLNEIHSVASFFVSRLDTEVDARLAALGTPEALALESQAGIANARLAYEVYAETFNSERAQMLLSLGAQAQRPLWASTGVKNPKLPDTLYVTELVASGTVNTMPAATLEALADHGEIRGDTVTTQYLESNQVLNTLDGLGIDYVAVTEVLESEGLAKFDASWDELCATVASALEEAVA